MKWAVPDERKPLVKYLIKRKKLNKKCNEEFKNKKSVKFGISCGKVNSISEQLKKQKYKLSYIGLRHKQK